MKKLVLGTFAWVIACGGTSVVNGSGSGGSGGSSSNNATSASGLPNPCNDHDDCNGSDLCIFSTGECAPACMSDICSSCGDGLICNQCATSSCPGCEDCEGACLAIEPFQCDADNACPPGQQCDFALQMCFDSCDEMGACSDPNMVCQSCVTGSCCGCLDCVDLCLPI